MQAYLGGVEVSLCRPDEGGQQLQEPVSKAAAGGEVQDIQDVLDAIKGPHGTYTAHSRASRGGGRK